MTQVKELMTGGVETIAPKAAVREAATRMSELNVGFLPVAENGRPIGVVTDRDIALRIVAAGRSPDETTVLDVMTAGIETVGEDSDAREAARLMCEKQIRRVLVTDPQDILSGVVSLGDLAVALDDKDLCADVLKHISEPCEPAR